MPSQISFHFNFHSSPIFLRAWRPLENAIIFSVIEFDNSRQGGKTWMVRNDIFDNY